MLNPKKISSKSISRQSQRLTDWLKLQAIPLWSGRGLDDVSGASCERLLASGQVDSEIDIRVRVQARQAFCFAAAQCRGWCHNGATLAKGLLEFVENKARVQVGKPGFGHLLNSQLTLIDQRVDLYDHAFFLLAYAWQYRVTKSEYWLEQAEKLVSYLDSEFAAPNGGWYEGSYVHSCRRQNPHMHLLEAFLALYEATSEARWLARAGEIIALFQTIFFNAKKSVLFEFFNLDWSYSVGTAGATVEPGHMFEWVWLLDWYERCSGRPVGNYIEALFTKALAIGVSRSGLVYDAVTASGEILDGNKRCWGLTELIKACLVRAKAGDKVAEKIAIDSIDKLFDFYLCASTLGAYVDRRGIDDQIVVAIAPASTLYHLIALAIELENFCLQMKE